jgi:hypothetical protein
MEKKTFLEKFYRFIKQKVSVIMKKLANSSTTTSLQNPLTQESPHTTIATSSDAICEKTIFMETLESTLKISHDWAQDRITHLTDSDNTEDAFALLQEFEEWFDPDIQEHDIISMGVLTDEEDT